VEAFPLKNFRANTVAEVFVREVVSRHGVPIVVHTDQGRNFESRLFHVFIGNQEDENYSFTSAI